MKNFILRSLVQLCLAGVATLFAVEPGTAPVAAEPPNPGTTYVLKPDDMLKLSVFEEGDLDTSTRILKTGEAVFPLIGAVDVVGLTLDAATSRIHDLYAAKYLVNPRVSLTVTEYGQQFISLLGAVKSPGTIPVPASGVIDLASALALAGGLADDADSESITMIRSSGATSVYSKSQVAKTGTSVQVRSGDRVVVGQSSYIGKSVTVLGKVVRPGPVPFPLDGALDLVGAISRAGGFHELANPKKVTVNRGGSVQVIDVREMSERGGDGFLLRPGDVVTIPERYF
jgi:polysaccharide export outer membrane protein